MIQAVASFGAGVFAGQRASSWAQNCGCGIRSGSELLGPPFKLAVHVHAASASALGAPGRVHRLRPRVELCFGGTSKETEDGDYYLPAATPASSSGARADITAASDASLSAPASASALEPQGALALAVRRLNYDLPTCAGVEACDAQRLERKKLRELQRTAHQRDTRGNAALDASAPAVVSGADACRPADIAEADFAAAAAEYPWRFGDTLTFAGRADDVLESGLRCRLFAHTELALGSVLQVHFPHAEEVGETVLDVRRRVLPVCERLPAGHFAGGHAACALPEAPRACWASPAIEVPLTRVSDHSSTAGTRVAVVAKVLLSFSVNADPEELLQRFVQAERPLASRVVAACGDCSRPCGAGAIQRSGSRSGVRGVSRLQPSAAALSAFQDSNEHGAEDPDICGGDVGSAVASLEGSELPAHLGLGSLLPAPRSGRLGFGF